MKRLLLGSLLSCMLVGQVFGEGYWIDLKGKIDGAAEGLALGGLVGIFGAVGRAVICDHCPDREGLIAVTTSAAAMTTLVTLGSVRLFLGGLSELEEKNKQDPNAKEPSLRSIEKGFLTGLAVSSAYCWGLNLYFRLK